MTTKPEPPKWRVTDHDSVRKSLRGMMAKRGLNQEGLAAKMKRGNLFSRFLRSQGTEANLRLDTFVDAVLAMGFEIVIQEPQGNITARRIAAAAAERDKRGQDQAVADLAAQGRDESGKLTRPLTDEEREQAEAILKAYGSF